MSLINEALRKARQAASEHEARPLEGPFQPVRAYPSRRSGRGGRLLAMALLVVAAGVAGAAAAWWILGDRQAASPDSSFVQRPSIEAPMPPTTQDVSATPADDRVDTPTAELLPRQEPAPAEAEQAVATSTPVVAVANKPITDSDGNRVFVMEAELGYASLSLGFIVARPNQPFAEINGTEVRIGSRIAGFTVEAIEADRVILRDDQGPLILRVP